MKACMVLPQTSESQMLAVLEQCQVCVPAFLSHGSPSLAQAGYVLSHHSWSVDRP